MAKKDSRVDAYIAKSADFAKPILKHLRKLAHGVCPQTEETLKWGMPHFLHNGILFGMAGFKQHCTLHFWHGKLFLPKNVRQSGGMGQFGRIASLADLPNDKTLIGYIKKAVELNKAGVKKTAPRRRETKSLFVPREFLTALNQNKKARKAFDNFRYSHKREYVQWVTEAKRPETRNKRLRTAIEWLAKGKPRNWKYLP